MALYLCYGYPAAFITRGDNESLYALLNNLPCMHVVCCRLSLLLFAICCLLQLSNVQIISTGYINPCMISFINQEFFSCFLSHTVVFTTTRMDGL